MICTGVVHYVVQINLDPPVMRFRNQAVEITFCAEFRIHFRVVCHIISVVRHAGVDGGEPDSFHAQLVDIVQFLGNAVQISIPVSVTVGKGVDQ